ncbi:glycosyltransferase family 2 protein [Butyribacter sp.]|uniref:glycosyltransferase family 2 protein n=1 Tax=Butyribacter sp. TaxID=2822465 RepID=UPI002A9B70EA|nr:glycosyltransferase family 2 protein [Butyribacter sp.]
MIVTVLTPTFNRGGLLNNLYQSLQKQTTKDFEWLLVDDGSTDDTKNIAEEMKKKAKFPMQYIYKKNGGKHTALNVGVKYITSELTFIVDSDDTLEPDAIELIFQYHKKYGDRRDLCGYSFLRKFPDGKINGKLFEPDEKVGTYIECRINADDTKADKAEVFYTRCLKEFPFPEYKNEKFLGEDLVWIRMALKYQMIHINRAIYVGNYLEEGLTKNRRKNNIRSPYGCMERAKEFMRPELKLRYRLKGAVQYLVYGKLAGEKQLIAKAPNKGLAVCAVLPGILVYHRWLRNI